MVYLVGAGMGGAGLITLRGMECISRADVIVYDHLIDLSLLNYAKDGCLLIYAGKSAGNHHMVQEETNKVLVKYGKNKNVVRLKGGDPLVFGRGSEEAAVLAEHNIEYKFIPGVSSSYGAAEYAGIPVTHRGVSSSFHVITGHEKSGGKSVDYGVLAKLKGTLVFLMGLNAAQTISESLIRNGKDPYTSAAVIGSAATEKQRCAVGELKNLAALAERLSPPAVIVVGDVVDERREWYKPSGKKIISTGTRQMNGQIKKAFGDTPVTEISLIKTTAVNYTEFQNTDLTAFSHIAFTSVNGVDTFFEYLRKAKKDIRHLAGIKFAVVGKKTAAALEENGIIPDIIPQTHSGDALSKLLREAKCENILLIRAQNGAQKLSDGLKGLKFTDLPIYRTETDFSKKELLNLTLSDTDYIILASGSAARAFCDMSETETNAKFIAIGKETARAAEDLGIKIYKTARHACAEGIAEIILGDEEND